MQLLFRRPVSAHECVEEGPEEVHCRFVFEEAQNGAQESALVEGLRVRTVLSTKGFNLTPSTCPPIDVRANALMVFDDKQETVM